MDITYPSVDVAFFEQVMHQMHQLEIAEPLGKVLRVRLEAEAEALNRGESSWH